MVTPGNNVIDVGCDHAYLAMYLVDNNIANDVIASDVNKGPLLVATNNINASGLSSRIKTILSNGISNIDTNDIQTMIIAGMGGNTIINIINNDIDKSHKFSEIIIEPQSDIYKIRKFLNDNCFEIIDENMVIESNKYYPIIKCKYSPLNTKTLSDVELNYGSILLLNKNNILYEFLTKQKLEFEKLIMDNKLIENSNTNSINNKIDLINKALNYY